MANYSWPCHCIQGIDFCCIWRCLTSLKSCRKYFKLASQKTMHVKLETTLENFSWFASYELELNLNLTKQGTLKHKDSWMVTMTTVLPKKHKYSQHLYIPWGITHYFVHLLISVHAVCITFNQQNSKLWRYLKFPINLPLMGFFLLFWQGPYRIKMVKMFQVLGLGTIWSQNIVSVLEVCLLVKFGAIHNLIIGCFAFSHYIGYNIFTFFFFVTKRVTFFFIALL